MAQSNIAQEPKQPAPSPTKVEVNLPPGMTAEQLNKLLSTFFKGKTYGKAYDEAMRNAVKALKEKFPSDWKLLYNRERTKVGLNTIS